MKNVIKNSENPLPEQVSNNKELNQNSNWFVYLVNGFVKIFRPEKRSRLVKLERKEISKDKYTETKITYRDEY